MSQLKRVPTLFFFIPHKPKNYPPGAPESDETGLGIELMSGLRMKMVLRDELDVKVSQELCGRK